MHISHRINPPTSYLNTIQTTCPHILRYLTAAVVTSRSRKGDEHQQILKDLVKVIQQVCVFGFLVVFLLVTCFEGFLCGLKTVCIRELCFKRFIIDFRFFNKPSNSSQESYTYSDPITDFISCLFHHFDFEGAQKKLVECKTVRYQS